MSEILGNIIMSRGDSYPLNLTVKGKSSGLPIDLTGYTFILTVTKDKDPIDNTTKIFEVAGVVDADQVINKGKVSFTPSSLDTSIAGKFYYDIEMKIDSLVRTISTTKDGSALMFTIIQDRSK